MTESLRLSILGGSRSSAIGATHVAAARLDGRYVIGPCYFSRDEIKNRQSHADYGLPWRGHPRTLISWLEKYKDEIDLVTLLTPSTDHADHICSLIDQNLSFLTEKPVACTRAEVERIREGLAAKPNHFARFVHNYSAYPLFRELVLRLHDGCIGKLHHLRVNMPSDSFARETSVGKPQNWRSRDHEIPMIMLDLGTHMHHLVRMMIGKAESSRLTARMHQMVNSLGVIDNVEIWEERTDDICVSYWMSKAHLGIKNGLKVEAYGSDGTLTWYQMEPDQLIEADIDSNCTVVNRGAIRSKARFRDIFKPGHPTGFVEAFGYFYSDIADDFLSIRDGGKGSPWICPFSDAFEGIEFLATAACTHYSRNWEYL